jgi:GT2 family glycosyltransferase
VAGRVFQPWDRKGNSLETSGRFRFSSSEERWIDEFMGGNFSVKRSRALELGGFDENFVEAAYRFEAEFSHRLLAAGGRIWFEPQASLRHLKSGAGGIRSFGNHLKTVKPGHTVGEYYYFLRCRKGLRLLGRLAARPFAAVKTRHHLRRPWWIPLTLIAEARAFLWAVRLAAGGPRTLLRAPDSSGEDERRT